MGVLKDHIDGLKRGAIDYAVNEAPLTIFKALVILALLIADLRLTVRGIEKSTELYGFPLTMLFTAFYTLSRLLYLDCLSLITPSHLMHSWQREAPRFPLPFASDHISRHRQLRTTRKSSRPSVPKTKRPGAKTAGNARKKSAV